MKLTEKNIAWVQVSFAALFLWGVANIGIGFSSKILGANVILFACISFASSSLMLLSISKHGTLAKETMRSVDTWIYGFILFIIYILLFVLFSKVSATEGSLLIMLGMNLSLLAGWFFLSRKPSKLQLIGNIIVFVGILIVAHKIDYSLKITVYMLTFLISSMATLRIFVAERHNAHTKAVQVLDSKSQIRVVAFIMFAVSIIFIVFTFGMSYLKMIDTGNAVFILKMFPDAQDFINPNTIFAGIIYGALIMAPLRYIEFSVASRIKTENYLAVTALAPASTLFWEWSTSNVTGLSVKSIDFTDLVALILITIGAFLAAISKMQKKKINDVFSKY